ncbi:MAG TPA: YigZ family protein [Candidatus Cloacimonadota bacterium]|nr:YigZ family protein [Candidatus Cloacimonadota bacterium]
MKYFYSVEQDRDVEIKIKRSIFIAHLHFAETMKDAKDFISSIAAEHKTANHNCWAYIVGDKGEMFHSSDAGEPGGTAGQPMLNALKKHDMTKIVAVVTRYFGGIKLGVPGLIEAYGKSVEEAINSQPLKKLVKYQEYNITTTYDFAEILKHRINAMNAEILNIEYTADVAMQIRIEEHLKEELENYLDEMNKSGRIRMQTN